MADSILFSEIQVAQAMSHPEFSNFVALVLSMTRRDGTSPTLLEAVEEAVAGLADADPEELLLSDDELLATGHGGAE